MKLPLTEEDLPLTATAAEDTQKIPLECPVPAPGHSKLCVLSYGKTDRGRVRTTNEDHFLIAQLTRALQVQQSSLPQPEVHYSLPRGHLFLVADGVGGNAAGEKASALTVSTLENFVVDALHWCIRLRTADEDVLLRDFQKALREADERLFNLAHRRPELRGMGTTTTMAYTLEDQLFVAHVGDSRCYLLRDGLLYRLTRDHTLVAEMVRRGLLKQEEVAQNAYRHVITNVVGGTDPGVDVEVHKLPLEAGDQLMLCTDGLTEMVSDQEILSILARSEAPAQACEQLVNRANEVGGRDNVTVIVARFEG
jgi:protein phosphatase